MQEDFTKYEAMKAAGASAEQVYQQAMRDGIDAITRNRLIRAVFSLTHAAAKEVIVRADGRGKSLDEFQARIVEAVNEGMTFRPLAEK
jgi:hypothetical protein